MSGIRELRRKGEVGRSAGVSPALLPLMNQAEKGAAGTAAFPAKGRGFSLALRGTFHPSHIGIRASIRHSIWEVICSGKSITAIASNTSTEYIPDEDEDDGCPMIWMYAGFICLVLLLLALDLGVFHRKAHVISIKEALAWSGFWIALGLSFGIFVYFGYEMHWLGLGMTPDMNASVTVDNLVIYNNGYSATVKYVTGYLVEKSLAVDNIFVIAMLFAFFAVPAIYQHRVLFWGIIGALMMRGAMIAIGAQLLREFTWIIYVFGIFLIATGIKMLLLKAAHTDPNKNVVVRLTRRLIPITEQFHGQHFFLRAGSAAGREPVMPGAEVVPDRAVESARPGILLATPLFLALVMIEVTDLIFAVDSIPAIFAITADPFLVFTSNVFAILGLRSLYFALAGMIDRFQYLKVSLALVLMIVGGKMMMHGWLKEILGQHFNLYLLGVVICVLMAGVVASLMKPRT